MVDDILLLFNSQEGSNSLPDDELVEIEGKGGLLRLHILGVSSTLLKEPEEPSFLLETALGFLSGPLRLTLSS